MTTKTPGSGGTDQTASVEAGTVHLVRLLQSLEADTTRNPSGINNIISSTSDDDRTFTATINIPINVNMTNDSTSYQLAAIDYLTTPSGADPHYVAGSGGTFKATTIQGALIQHIIYQKNLELDANKNPTGVSYVSYQISNVATLGNGNATFAAQLTNLPLLVTNNSDGTQITSGKTYLL